MKCNRIAVYGWKSKYHKNTNPRVLFGTKDLDGVNPAIYKTWDICRTAKCEGEIESEIVLEEIPYYGGSDYNIEVRFRCKRCGSEFAGESGLPSDIDSLNEFLTNIISKYRGE